VADAVAAPQRRRDGAAVDALARLAEVVAHRGVCNRARNVNTFKDNQLYIYIHALAKWRIGHSIRLRNRRPGFESRQGIRF
jgi:pyridoxal biosynthesis lyase PdxS